jgi:hypothetical protein
MALDEISKRNPNTNQWIAILDVAEKHKFELQQARALALQQLTNALVISQSPINWIRWARQYKVGEWLRLGLRRFVEGTHISEEEQMELGSETTCKLYRIREKYRDRSRVVCKVCRRKESRIVASGESHAILEDIGDSFKEELMTIERGSDGSRSDCLITPIVCVQDH